MPELGGNTQPPAGQDYTVFSAATERGSSGVILEQGGHLDDAGLANFDLVRAVSTASYSSNQTLP